MLKIIAAILMTVDHIGLIWFPQILLLRGIGRIAMPLYAFMVARACKVTAKHESGKRYGMSLAVMTVTAQLPRTLMAGTRLINIGASWFCGFLLINLFERQNQFRWPAVVATGILICTGCLEYDFLAIGYVVLFYATRIKRTESAACFLGAGLLNLLYLQAGGWPIEFFSILALPLIDLANRYELQWQSKRETLRYFWYVYYPTHMYVLTILKTIL